MTLHDQWLDQSTTGSDEVSGSARSQWMPKYPGPKFRPTAHTVLAIPISRFRVIVGPSSLILPLNCWHRLGSACPSKHSSTRYSGTGRRKQREQDSVRWAGSPASGGL